MKKKVIKLNEKELETLVRKIIKEDNGDWSEDEEEEYRSNDPDQLSMDFNPEVVNELVDDSKEMRDMFIEDLPYIAETMIDKAYESYWDDVNYRTRNLEKVGEKIKKINPHHPELEEIEKWISDMNDPESLISVKINTI